MNRLKTGIQGFDELIGGGVPESSLVLVSGLAGSGKTIFGLQFLEQGATKFNERGLFISFEQVKRDIISQATQLGFKLDKLEKNNKLKLLTFRPSETTFTTMITEIKSTIEKFQPKRLVLDSISTYGTYAENISFVEMLETMGFEKGQMNFNVPPEIAMRRAIITLLESLKSLEVTSLIISELPETTNYLSRDTISEFLADGVVLLKHVPIGDSLNRNLEVRKMRQTKISGGPRSYEITEKGIIIEKTTTE